MFRKRKRDIENMQEKISTLEIRYYTLKVQVIGFKQKIKQLECKHNFRFDRYHRSLMSCFVYHKCTECDKITVKGWDNIAKKGQQALKLLNLVPKDWKTKGDKK